MSKFLPERRKRFEFGGCEGYTAAGAPRASGCPPSDKDRSNKVVNNCNLY